MELTFLKAKLHRATVTHSEPDYDGSCAIDTVLLETSGIHEYEQIDVYNISNGKRLTTYAIKAPPSSGVISMNGAAAHCATPGDLVIVAAYCRLTAEETKNHHPVLVYLDAQNRKRALKTRSSREDNYLLNENVVG